MTHLEHGLHAALWLVGLLLGLAVIAIPIVVLAAVAWAAWNGPAARAGMRVRAWRYVHRLRQDRAR